MYRFMVFALALPLAAADPSAAGLNAFSGDLYQQLARNRGNLVFSRLASPPPSP